MVVLNLKKEVDLEKYGVKFDYSDITYDGEIGIFIVPVICSKKFANLLSTSGTKSEKQVELLLKQSSGDTTFRIFGKDDFDESFIRVEFDRKEIAGLCKKFISSYF